MHLVRWSGLTILRAAGASRWSDSLVRPGHAAIHNTFLHKGRHAPGCMVLVLPCWCNGITATLYRGHLVLNPTFPPHKLSPDPCA